MAEISDDKMRWITSNIIDGLNAPDQDHKQFFLEQALRLLTPDEFEDCKKSWQWEDGVGP